MELEFTPGILDTPSLLTPNIAVTPLLYKSPQTDSVPTDNDLTQTDSTSNPSSIMTVITTTNDESLSVSSAEVKLSKIENDLKQSFSQPRKPTESPFQRIVEAGVLSYEKNSTILPPTMSDGIPANVPSTAEVVNDIESFSKAAASKEVNEREATVSDTSPSQAMGVIVSPKKKLLFRSQSHTDPASPTSVMINTLSQLQKPLRDEDNSTDEDHNHHFQRLQDLPILTQPVDPSAQLDNNHETTYTIQVRTNSNGAQQTISKQQATVLSNKRSFASAVLASPMTKANSILLSQPAVINEVSSSDQSLGSKRQKTSSNTSRISLTLPTTDDDDNNTNNSAHSDDQRKKQIRDSNREAARRCRERRRNYIEQLEGNLEGYKTQIKQLTENLARAERENTQLRAIISEAKLFPSAVRMTTNDVMMDFSSNGIDVASETTDGNTIQRSFVTRNTR